MSWIKRIENPEKVRGIGVFETTWVAKGSAICLPGFGIFLSYSIPETSRLAIIQHEYGHFLDYKNGIKGEVKKVLGSRVLGFYLKIGLPSLFNLTPLLNQLTWFKGPHRLFWTEIRANKLAADYFGNQLASGFENRFPTRA